MGQKPGDLYLGSRLDESTSEPTEARLELPSHGLTTHGVIVGMTGSGKTGLGVVLLEEILSAGIPALILDPKGDMGNLLLNFPAFDPKDFRPWIDEGEARRKGISPEELAEGTADLWKSGLARSGIEPSRMRELTQRVDFRILTPGSSAGIPLNVIGDLSPPDISWEEEGETVRDEIEGLVSGILVMADLDADPLTSKEHILLSNLVEHAWKNGVSLNLPSLDRADPATAPPSPRSVRTGHLLPGSGADQAGHAVERAGRLSLLFGVDPGRTPGYAGPSLHAGRPPPGQHRLPVPPVGLGAGLCRDSPPVQARHLDAKAARDFGVEGLGVRRRGHGIRTPHGRAALQTPYPHALQAGQGPRRRNGPGHTEPGGSGLQTHVQRRNVDDRAPSNRAGQGPDHRSSPVRIRRRGRGRPGMPASADWTSDSSS